jgi:hypothetical protein
MNARRVAELAALMISRNSSFRRYCHEAVPPNPRFHLSTTEIAA